MSAVGLSHGQVRSQEFMPGLPCGFLGHYWWPAMVCISRKLELEVDPRFEAKHSYLGSSYLKVFTVRPNICPCPAWLLISVQSLQSCCIILSSFGVSFLRHFILIAFLWWIENKKWWIVKYFQISSNFQKYYQIFSMKQRCRLWRWCVS